jgi:hypothetical protein
MTALQAIVRLRLLIEAVDNAGGSLDECSTGRGAGHEPLLAVMFVDARDAGDVAKRGGDTLTEVGFERFLSDVLHHADGDQPAADLVDTACIHVTDFRIVGLPEPFLLDLGVLRLDLPYLIAHDAMLAPWHSPAGTRSAWRGALPASVCILSGAASRG